MVKREPTLDRSTLEIWKYFYYEAPDVAQVKTPFWPDYVREQAAYVLQSVQDEGFDLEAVLPHHRVLLREAIRALAMGGLGCEDPNPQDARRYDQETRKVYEQYAVDYANNTIDRSLLDHLLVRFISLITIDGPVLDVGCGPGGDLMKLSVGDREVIGVDLALSMLYLVKSITGKTFSVVQMDMRKLGFRKESVSGIWCVATLLHLLRTEVPGTLFEFWQVLKPSGVLFISVKQGTGTELVRRAKTRGFPRLFTYFSQDEIVDRLHEARFHVYEVSKNVIFRKGIGWDVWLNLLAHKRQNPMILREGNYVRE